MVRRPNFFIVGAPKCGTTSMANWLAEHPQVYISPAKEPHFFNFDYGERDFRSLKRYEALFANASAEHLAIGEASTRYLYSATAVPAILKYADRPRFIVMVRNPVEMAYSLHGEAMFTGDEDVSDFDKAWALQATRVYGGHIPNSCTDPQLLLYGRVCKTGRQVSRLLQRVLAEDVLVLNLEQVRADPRREYLKALAFLGVNDDGREHFPVANAAKQRLFPRTWRVIKGLDRVLRDAGFPHIRLGLMTFINSRDRRVRPRPPMSEATRLQLQQYFLDDIVLLEELTGWDLTHWKQQ